MADINKLQSQKNRLELELIRLKNDEDRKSRTRRLIQKGALLEKYFEIDNLSVSETEELLSLFARSIKEKKPAKFKKSN